MSKLVLTLYAIKNVIGEENYDKFSSEYSLTTTGGYILSTSEKVVLRTNDFYYVLEYVCNKFNINSNNIDGIL